MGELHLRAVGRKPAKPKKGEPFRLHIILPGEVVEEVDAITDQLRSEDPYQRSVTRTDALRILITEAVKARRERRRK